jgi:polyhydroxybutyrate depolymerase
MEGNPIEDQPINKMYGAERSIPDRVGAMAVRNGCEPEPVAEVIREGVERLSWNCPTEGDVGLVVIDGWGHAWPGAFAATNDRGVHAGQMLWEFFEQHPMPE